MEGDMNFSHGAIDLLEAESGIVVSGKRNAVEEDKLAKKMTRKFLKQGKLNLAPAKNALREGFYFKSADEELMTALSPSSSGMGRFAESFLFPVYRDERERVREEAEDREFEDEWEANKKFVEQGVEQIRNAPLSAPLHVREWNDKSESPNTVPTLTRGPHIDYACGFKRKTKKKVSKELHPKPWNESIAISWEPPRKVSLIREIRKPELSPLKKGTKVVAPIVEEKPERLPMPPRAAQRAYSPATNDDVILEGIEYDIQRGIVGREGLLQYAKDLCKAQVLDTTEFVSTLVELRKAGGVIMEALLRRYHKMNKTKCDSTCSFVHTHTYSHKLKPFDLDWKGRNYLLKMGCDLNFADQIFKDIADHDKDELKEISTLYRNPFVLKHNLDVISQNMDLSCPESELWKRLDDSVSETGIRLYQHALVIIREELHYGRVPVELPSIEITTMAQVDKAAMMQSVTDQVALSGTPSRGCWKRKPTGHVISPFLKRKATTLFTERVLQLEQKLKACEVRRRNATCIKRRTRASRLIQQYGMKFLLRLRGLKSHACVLFQSAFRRFLARIRYTILKELQADYARENQVKCWIALAESSAKKIQSIERMIKARRFVQMVRQHVLETISVTKIANWYRTITQRHRFFMVLLVARVQEIAREQKAKKITQMLRLNRDQKRGAIAVQSLFRQVRARSYVQKVRETHHSKIIQKSYRGMHSRKQARQLRGTRKIQTIWRGYVAKAALPQKLEFWRAAKVVQAWHRQKHAEEYARVELLLSLWRDRHTSIKRCYKRGVFIHQCSLYDSLTQLEQRRALLTRCIVAKGSLRMLKERLENAMRNSGDKDTRTAIRGTRKVKARYERLLVLVKHLSDDEINAELSTISIQIKANKEKIDVIESLARRRFRAEAKNAQVNKVADQIDPDPSNTRFDYSMFKGTETKAFRNKRIKRKVQGLPKKLFQRQHYALLSAQWKYHQLSHDLFNMAGEVKQYVRKKEAKVCAKQIAGFINGAARVRAIRKRIDLARTTAIHNKTAGMIAEDEYAHVFRGYLSASTVTLKAYQATFDKHDKSNSGDLTPQQFQMLAFELGVTVPLASINEYIAAVDLDGNGTIDFMEFCVWNFAEGRAKMMTEKHKLLKVELQVKNAVMNLKSKMMLRRRKKVKS